MDNPFESPTTSRGAGAPGQGSLDLGLAFSDGTAAMQRNLGPWLIATILGSLVVAFSVLACLLPAFVVIPAIMWGMNRVALDAVDGNAQADAVWSGFQRLGDALIPMWAYFGVLFLIQVPVMALGFVANFLLPADEPTLQLAWSLVQQVLTMAWTALFSARIALAPFLAIEDNRGMMDAISRSWELTEGRWGQMILLNIGVQLIALAGFLLCCVGVLFTGMIGQGAAASAYRQLTGTRR